MDRPGWTALVQPDLPCNDGPMNRHAPSERRADKFRLVAYPTARGCAADYFPEANALVHRGLVARESNTPGFKAMAVRFVKHGS
jgi:formate dehydrogenase major subunit